MNKLKIKIIYDGKHYKFDDGLKAYIFHIGVQNHFDKKHGIEALLNYTNLVSSCVYAKSNETVADFAKFVSNRWRLVEDMDSRDLLELYYEEEIY